MDNLDSFSLAVCQKLKRSLANTGCAYETVKKQLVADFVSPSASGMGGMIVQTTNDHHIWLRIYPGCSAYLIVNIDDLIDVMLDVMADKVLWSIGFSAEEWIETTLIRDKNDIELQKGVEYRLYSWSGELDEVLQA